MSAPRSAISLNLLLFIEQSHVLNIPAEQAGKLTTFYMVFAMIGRFAGSALLKTVKDYVLLMLVALGAIALCVVVIADQGHDGHAARRHAEPDPGPCPADQRPDPGLRGDADRPVQLDHVPDDLHPDPATVLGADLGDLGPAVHGHRGRRVPSCR
jgi:hypothetical protein